MGKDNLATALALIIVEVDGSEIEQGRTYKDKVTGITKPLPGTQAAYIWQGAKYPTKFALRIPEGKPPYRPGSYLLAGELFGSVEYGNLAFKGDRNLDLIDIASAVEALAAIASEESNVANLKTGTKG